MSYSTPIKHVGRAVIIAVAQLLVYVLLAFILNRKFITNLNPIKFIAKFWDFFYWLPVEEIPKAVLIGRFSVIFR